MQSCLFPDNFWGEKHSGFDVLSQNLKYACRSTSDFVEFLRESYAVEDSYFKSLTKLAKQVGSYSTSSTFKPCWGVVRQLIEQIGLLHSNFAQEYQRLSKAIQKYLEEQQKQQKSVKDAESSTQEVIQAFQASTLQLQKAKELYHSRYAEHQRLLRNESSSTRDQEKSETKLKKAQHEYKYSIEKYNNLRGQFVNKFHASCVQFQEIEMTHLEQMREFLGRYGSVWGTARDTLDTLFAQFNHDLAELTTERLLQLFVNERGTGNAMPQVVTFEDAEVATLFAASSNGRTTGLSAISTSALFGRELRVSSALAVGEAETKDNRRNSRASLNDLSGDSASVNSIPASGTSTTVPSLPKRHERFFRRRRNSPHESIPAAADSGADAVSDQTGSATQHSSAFNLVAKLGSLHFGAAFLNGRDKVDRKSEILPDSPEDWRTNTSADLPKDEESFSIPPSEPWTSMDDEHSNVAQSSSDSETEVDVIGRSFKGLKLQIRPAGQFAPGVSTVDANDASDKKQDGPLLSGRTLLPALNDRRCGKDVRVDSLDTIQTAMSRVIFPPASGAQTVGTSLIRKLPTAPALPPPPSSVCMSNDQETSSRGRLNGDLTATSSSATHVRPRVSGFKTWHKTPLCAPTCSDSTEHPQSDRAFLSVQPDSLVTKAENGAQLDSNLTVARGVSQSPLGRNSTPSNWCSFDSEPANPSWNKEQSTSAPLAWPQFLRTSSSLAFDASAPVSRPVPPLPEPPARTCNPSASNNESTLSVCSFESVSPSPLIGDGAVIAASHHVYQVPVAAAFVETWEARFLNGGGSSFSTAASITPPPSHFVSGSLTLAFPTSTVKQLSVHCSLGPLVLRLHNAGRLQNIQLKLKGSTIRSQVSSSSNTVDYAVAIPEGVLSEHLSDLFNNNVDVTSHVADHSCSPYLRFTVLTYEVDVNAGASYGNLSPPIHMCTYWRCERDATDFRLDYTTNWPSNTLGSTRDVSGELHITMKVDGDVTRMQSLPAGVWAAERHQALWKIPLAPPTDTEKPPSTGDMTASPRIFSNNTAGTVRAKFALLDGPGRPQSVALRFLREECLASGLYLTLDGSGYRLSLCKRRIIGDRYICDPPSRSPRFQLHPPPRSRTANGVHSPPPVVSHDKDVSLISSNEQMVSSEKD